MLLPAVLPLLLLLLLLEGGGGGVGRKWSGRCTLMSWERTNHPEWRSGLE